MRSIGRDGGARQVTLAPRGHATKVLRCQGKKKFAQRKVWVPRHKKSFEMCTPDPVDPSRAGAGTVVHSQNRNNPSCHMDATWSLL